MDTMKNLKAIYAGFGGTAPGDWEDGSCVWHDIKVFIHPLIDGISENLWKKLWNETNEDRPMIGKDGSKVYYDDERYQIIRRINGQEIPIANVTYEG